MSKADKIFKKLGYKMKEVVWPEDNKLHYVIYKSSDTLIEFWLDDHILFISHIISFEELKAINEKVKELGW